ncbi:class I SAM-dependent methyltransferase [Caldibacillus debilis]|uniref:class I SAM-dependent methyltransferase n=1 Tax=Caldibacillus debilis TaxID=301148 RepID=UPI002FD8D393
MKKARMFAGFFARKGEKSDLTDHYYSPDPSAESRPSLWQDTLRGFSLTFKTDRGVFSKKRVDFGTRLLIESFSADGPSGPILDLGCGYGPIGLAVAKSFPARIVHMVDVNRRALELAEENANINGCSNALVYESDGFAGISERSFAAILSNPPIRAGKKVVYPMFEKSFEHLADGGRLWIVIQKKQGAPSALKKLEEIFAEVETVRREKGYYVFCAKKI